MTNSKVRRLMVAVALIAVAGAAGAGAAGFPGHRADAPPGAVVSGDLGEVVVYAPGDLGEVVVYAPHVLPEVLVSAARVPFDAPLLVEAGTAAAALRQDVETSLQRFAAGRRQVSC